ncbi:MAG: DUF2946 family protein [Alphaproteobacteria bacterium]
MLAGLRRIRRTARSAIDMRQAWRPTTFRARGRTRTVGIALATIALSFQIAFPIFFTAPLAAFAAPSSSASDLVICTSHGLVTLPSDSPPAGDASDEAGKIAVKPLKCPLCQAFQGLGAMLAPTASSFVALLPPTADHPAILFANARGRAHFEPLQARAPPPTAS